MLAIQKRNENEKPYFNNKKIEIQLNLGFLGEILTKKKFSRFCGNLTDFLDAASRFQNFNLATLDFTPEFA